MCPTSTLPIWVQMSLSALSFILFAILTQWMRAIEWRRKVEALAFVSLSICLILYVKLKPQTLLQKFKSKKE